MRSSQWFCLTSFLMIFAASFNLRAAENDDFETRWERAAKAYEAKDYSLAQNIYEDMLKRDESHPAISYNLGNCYFLLWHPGRAAWMYEKTLKIAPRHHDARQNLELIRTKAGLSEQPVFFIFRPLLWIARSLSSDEWLGLLAFANFLTGIVAGGWILSQRASAFRQIAKYLTFISLSSMVLLACFALPRYRESEVVRFAVVVQEGMVVRSAPRKDGDAYFEVVPSQRLEELGLGYGGWKRVKNPADGRVGFLPESALARI